ncbi:hypothetical protein NXS19_001171 [Fusarium pseudograminearum]|nr:hypothetical protein NXS19_001171 [Fusarium pseudograminearum]
MGIPRKEMEEVHVGVLAGSCLSQSLLTMQVQAYTATEPRPTSSTGKQPTTLTEDKSKYECVKLVLVLDIPCAIVSISTRLYPDSKIDTTTKQTNSITLS